MLFEEVLPFLRKGKRVRCKDFDSDGQYWEVRTLSPVTLSPSPNMTIVRMDKNHSLIKDKPYSHLPRWSVLNESWEVVEGS